MVHQGKPIDYPLLALEYGMPEFLSGDDAGPLTEAIEWCKTNGQYQVMLSEAPALLQHVGIEVCIVKGVNGDRPDHAAVSRHAERTTEHWRHVIRTR